MSDDNKLFVDEMADVNPIKSTQRVRKNAVDRPSDPSIEARRKSAVSAPVIDRNQLVEEGVAALDPWYVLEFKRPGVQNGVFRKLRQGRYEMEAQLDLHRMTVAVARRELFAFVEEARKLGLRSVLIVHGKGERGREGEKSSILKGFLQHWLAQLDPVMAFHSAQPQQGGTGAVYVLLQKSDDMKRENRLRFMRGRVPPQ